MSLVTLLTDFGLEDEYVGVMKGVILSVDPHARMVDLCHAIPPGDIRKAAWMLGISWPFFPQGTVHVAVVDPGVGSSRKLLCLAHRGQFFLAPDNGLLHFILCRIKKPRLYSITNRRYALKKISHTFHGRDILAPAAGHLSKGLNPARLGFPVRSYETLQECLPVKTKGGTLKGVVIHLDRFGNAVTNFSVQEIRRLGKRGKLELGVKGPGPHSSGCRIRGLATSYSAVSKGKPLLVIGSRGLLEIALNRGSAAKSLRIREGDPVRLRRG